MSTSALFQQALGAEVATLLGSSYKFFKSRGELRAEVEGGHHVVVLSGSSKYSPHVEINFYFGKNFTEAKRIEKQLGINQCYCHIQQYSPRCQFSEERTYRGPCNWSVDISSPPPTLAADVAKAIVGLSSPFLANYGRLQSARDAIAHDDPNVLGGQCFWSQLLLLDLALGDLQHFKNWSAHLDELSRSQSEDIIKAFQSISRK